MTKLEKQITRLAKQEYKGAQIVVTLEPHGVIAVKRLKHHERFCVPFESLFEIAMRSNMLEEQHSQPEVKLRKWRAIRATKVAR